MADVPAEQTMTLQCVECGEPMPTVPAKRTHRGDGRVYERHDCPECRAVGWVAFDPHAEHVRLSGSLERSG